MQASGPLDGFACPACGEVASKEELAGARYHCRRCALELAHLDVTPTGSVRSVIGWLRVPGDVLQDRYQVISFLGRGGFAATYLVEDLRLKGKRRAVKEIPRLLYDEYEMELLSRLHHPGIPDIIDRFDAGEMVNLVLEFAGSRSLETERRAEGGTLSLAKLGPWIQQICATLEYLHSRTPPVVHRDLKPQNILLDDHDRVRLIDFGIAKQAEELATTRTIARSATQGFSPPEQALGTGTDQRSDVYALGATLYFLLSGVMPPPAHERIAGKELVPPRTLNPAISPRLDSVLVRMLDLNINRRPQSIGEVKMVFDAEIECAEPPPARPLPSVATRDGSPSTLRIGSQDGSPVRRSPHRGWIGPIGLALGAWTGWAMYAGHLPRGCSSVTETPTVSPHPDGTETPGPRPEVTRGHEAIDNLTAVRTEVASTKPPEPSPTSRRLTSRPGNIEQIRTVLLGKGLDYLEVEMNRDGSQVRLRSGTKSDFKRAATALRSVYPGIEVLGQSQPSVPPQPTPERKPTFKVDSGQ